MRAQRTSGAIIAVAFVISLHAAAAVYQFGQVAQLTRGVRSALTIGIVR